MDKGYNEKGEKGGDKGNGSRRPPEPPNPPKHKTSPGSPGPLPAMGPPPARPAQPTSARPKPKPKNRTAVPEVHEASFVLLIGACTVQYSFVFQCLSSLWANPAGQWVQCWLWFPAGSVPHACLAKLRTTSHQTPRPSGARALRRLTMRPVLLTLRVVVFLGITHASEMENDVLMFCILNFKSVS